MDFTVVRLPAATTCSAVFTRSLSASGAVRFDRRNAAHGGIQVLCVISKNANVFTPSEDRDIDDIAAALSTEFDVPTESVFISCTGVIGVPLPMAKIIPGVSGLRNRLEEGHLERSAEAILTTDKAKKMASIKLGDAIICGFAKGAGMIEPKMATMLAYFFTNLRVEKPVLDGILWRVVNRTFNAISVDTDTSTSDTVAIFTTNECDATDVSLDEFETALTALSLKLARDIVGQGEGVTKIIEADVRTDVSEDHAMMLAKNIINSPLVKTAVHGADPNWGKVVMAIGKPPVNDYPAGLDPSAVQISILGQVVWDRGKSVPVDLAKLSEQMAVARSVRIGVIIGGGSFAAKAWGCDLSEAYVELNAQYTT